MGWSTANYIFDPVARALIESDADDAVIRHTLGVLIRTLQDGDWDTAPESLERFAGYPPIVAAFREHGVYLKCGWRTWPDSYQRYCALPRDHQGDHKENECAP